MKLSDDEVADDVPRHSKKEKKKKKRTHQEFSDAALEDMDEERINAELVKYGMNPDDLKLEDELPQIVEQKIETNTHRKCK
jgi:hypothetical protein